MTTPTPLPYTTRFYNTHLQGIFGLAYNRIGFFRNAGDREELEKHLLDNYLLNNIIEEAPTNDKSAKLFRIKDTSIKLKRTEKILRSLVRLRGGAKQAQFGTDVSPKLIILAGLTSGNLIFNDLFEDTKEFVTNPREQKRGDSVEVVNSKVVGGTRIKLDTLKQIIWDYRDRIVTPIYIGLRKGYLSKDNENELLEWVKSNEKWKEDAFGNEITENDNKPDVQIVSPIEAVEQLLSKLKELESNKNDEL
jgi:CRISPR-associated protein Cst2